MVQIIESTTLTREEVEAIVNNRGVVPNPVEETSVEVSRGVVEAEDESNEENSESDTTEAEAPHIQENEVTTTLEGDNRLRFSAAPWASMVTNARIVLIGAGGIGSWTGLFLSRINPFSIDVIDPDSYDVSNMAGQFCGSGSIRYNKATEIRRFSASMSNYYRVNPYSSGVQDLTGDIFSYKDVIIGGLDNMSSRKYIFDKWIASKDPGLFIDARLAAEEFQVYCLEPTDKFHINKYREEALFSDEEAEHTLCSYKQTSHCAAMVGSVITGIIVNYFARKASMEDSPEYLKRAIPYLTTYDAVTMRFKTVMV